MLSPGGWNEYIPKDRIQNLVFRETVLGKCQTDGRFREAMMEACRQDILFWVNCFCYIYEPRKRQTYPWITWEFQDEAILKILYHIEHGLDLVIFKSRDMGVSWKICAIQAWLWQFHKGCNFLTVSRKEKLVDEAGDPDSLFWKIDFLLRYQPNWMTPDPLDRRKFHFGNEKLNSTIDGESTTGGAGVGGRRTAMFIDEFSRIEHQPANEILSGTADTTNCRIFNFTYWGPRSHPSYKLAERAERGEVGMLRLHWTLHPEKTVGLYKYNVDSKLVEVLDQTYNFPEDYKFVKDGKTRSPWYDGEEQRRDNKQDMALMIDMNIEGFGGLFYDRDSIERHSEKYGMDPIWEGDLDYDRDTGEPIRLVETESGPLKFWFTPDNDGNPPPGDYAAGCDVSGGQGATPTVLSIGSALGEKVAEYADANIDAYNFAAKAVALCKLFKNPYGAGAAFAWEVPGPGGALGKRVIELGYTRIYRRTVDYRSKWAIPSETAPAGWAASKDSKRILHEEYRAAISLQGRMVNRSRRALAECLDFGFDKDGRLRHKSEKSDDPSATGENHGDFVVADALLWMMMKNLGADKSTSLKDDEPPPGELSMRTMVR